MTTTIAIDEPTSWEQYRALLPSNTIHRVTHTAVLCTAANVVCLKLLRVIYFFMICILSSVSGLSVREDFIPNALLLVCFLLIPVWPILATMIIYLVGFDWRNTFYNGYYSFAASFTIFGTWFFPNLILDIDEMLSSLIPPGMRSFLGGHGRGLFRLGRSSDTPDSQLTYLLAIFICVFIIFFLLMTAASMFPRRIRFFRFRYLPKSPSLTFLIFSFLPGLVLATTYFFITDLDLPAREFVSLNLLGIIIVPFVAGLYGRRFELGMMCLLNYLGLGGMALWVRTLIEIL